MKLRFKILIAVTVIISSNSYSSSKILCLHGGGGSAASFNAMPGMQDLIDELPQLEFLFVDSPLPSGTWYDDPPSKENPTQDRSWANDSILFLESFVEANGPFYGLLGYSQGVPMALVYLAQSETHFDKIFLYNGYLPETHLGLLELIDEAEPFEQQTMIFLARNDIFFELGLSLKSKFAKFTEIISESSGHFLPQKSDSVFTDTIQFFNVETSLRNYKLRIFSSQNMLDWNLMNETDVTSDHEILFLKAEIE